MAEKEVILYVGGFELPDKNAAAQRVVGNAHALKELGYEVIFLNRTKTCNGKKEKREYFGFTTIDVQKKGWGYYVSAKGIKKAVKEYKVSKIICYNYPAIALRSIIKLCKKRGIKCYADVTEWYEIKGNPIKKAIKGFDVSLRMEKLHKKVDGVIAISQYLYDYYNKSVKTVKIPPLVNVKDEKWTPLPKLSVENETVFSYVGSPSARKEKLDLIARSVENLSKKKKARLIVVGVTKEQYQEMYSTKIESRAVEFLGRVPHETAVKIVKTCDWTIVIRDNVRFVRAGFPTKVVESISCGTPVIANRFSNVQDYLTDENGILFDKEEELYQALEKACEEKKKIDNGIFDYSNYLEEFEKLLS